MEVVLCCGMGVGSNCLAGLESPKLSLWTQPQSEESWNRRSIDLSHFDLSSSSIAGIGGFSIVRRVIKLSDGADQDRLYAIKQISKEMCLSRPTGRLSAFQELKILECLSTSASASIWVCRLKYAFQTLTSLYMVIDIAYGDMRFHLRKNQCCRFSESMCRFYAVQIMCGLSEIHKHGVLHRDIKPENLLLSREGYIKVTDFGISKVVGEGGMVHTTSGTHGYMSPEIYSKKDHHAHSWTADYFAAGVTIHELLFGCRPFDPSLLRSGLAQPNAGQHLASLFRDQHISSSCKNFVQELLKFDPACRLGASGGYDEILAHEWLHTYPHKAAVLKRKLVPSYLPAVSDFASQHLSNSSIREAVEKMNSSAEVPYDEFVGYEFNCSLRGRSSKDPLSPISPSLATVLLPGRRSGHSTPAIIVEKTHSSERSGAVTSNDKETSGGLVPVAMRSISSCVFETPLADCMQTAVAVNDLLLHETAIAMAQLRVRVNNKSKGVFASSDSTKLVFPIGDSWSPIGEVGEVLAWQMNQNAGPKSSVSFESDKKK